MRKENTFYVILSEKRDPSEIYANSNLRNPTHITQKPSYVYTFFTSTLKEITALWLIFLLLYIWIMLATTFSEKSFQTLSDRIESVGKNRFLPLSFKNKSFFDIYKYLLKEVKSRWFGIELSQVGKNCFLLFPVRMEITCRNWYSTRERNGA
jgi:hypothetical protein